ncbi:MAG: sensor histidine kinase [Planctomycetota bacterium]
MNDASLLSGVVHAMGLLVIAQERNAQTGDERFVWVGRLPEWAAQYGCRHDEPCEPSQHFTFLDFFLEEARDWWAKQPEDASDSTLRSEVWAEPDRDGVDHQLEAVALRVGGQGVLVIAGVGLEFSQAQSILQTARERRLATDRELAVRQLVEEQLRQRVAERTAELDASNQQLRALASEVALAEQRERHRLAIGLHDHVGQLLAVAKMRLSSEAAKSSEGESKKRLQDTIGLLADAIDATRSLTFELSPPMLYELGLIPTLSTLVEQTAERHAPLDCVFEDDGQPKPLDTDFAVLLFQVVRELITNTLKHAQATRLKVSTRRQDQHVELVVEDDGAGFEVEQLDRPRVGKGGFGLLSVRERLSPFGAQLTVESRQKADSEPSTEVGFGYGTRSTIRVPLKSD